MNTKQYIKLAGAGLMALLLTLVLAVLLTVWAPLYLAAWCMETLFDESCSLMDWIVDKIGEITDGGRRKA